MARTKADRPWIGVDAGDVVAVPEEVDEIAAAAAARVDDAHAGCDPSTKELIEEIDIDLAELGHQIRHVFFFFFCMRTASNGRLEVGLT